MAYGKPTVLSVLPMLPMLPDFKEYPNAEEFYAALPSDPMQLRTDP